MRPVHKLTLAGLLVAIDIISARFLYTYLPPGTQLVRISPQFLAHALSGWILGPWWAIGSAIAGDLLGMFMFPNGTFHIGYTVSPAVGGALYGLLLWRRPVRLWRCLLAVSVVVLGVSLCLTTTWNMIYFNLPWVQTLVISLPWRLVSIPIYTMGLFAVQKGLYQPLKRYVSVKS